jgi:uncharacterized protein (DUF433 family)/DNA-binding transcriptional MerR regulator
MNLLTTGIYTISAAADLVGVSRQKVRGWVTGYPRTKVPPIIENEVGWLNDRVAFSFANLMEIKFIAFFEGAGIRPSHIRSIMGEVRDALDHPHPFATKLVFRTDGHKIVAEIVLKNSGKLIYDLRSKNYEMHTIVMETLMEGVVYDAEGIARAWYPRQSMAPNVIVHPKFAFGQPILRDSQIPTQTIADAVKSEGGVRAVARWYEIPEKQVREAVKFQAALREAA